jgi:hypothetical protein
MRASNKKILYGHIRKGLEKGICAQKRGIRGVDWGDWGEI